MKLRRLIGLLACVGAAPACDIGDGVGAARGSLFVNDCAEDDDGRPLDFRRSCESADGSDCYDLQPAFFAAEPIEDISPGQKQNRLLIRLQRSGKRIEVNDTLVFDIPDVRTVAACVGSATGSSPEVCDWSTGVPRLKVGTDLPIRTSLSVLATCRKRVIGVATSTTSRDPTLWESWIELDRFGVVTPGWGGEVGPDFKVKFGESVRARAFQVTLQDDRVVKAPELNNPPPEPAIGGRIDGNFDFELRRSRAAQAFP